MAVLTASLRVLRLHERQWARIDPMSLWAGAGVAVGAALLLALARLGGLVATEPRSFFRLALVAVWGWLGLAVAIWLLSRISEARQPRGRPFQITVAAVGLAHVPLLVLAIVVFVAANMFQLLGPGLVTAWFVFAFWLPANLTMAARRAASGSTLRAIATVAVPYALWLLVVGRHLLDRIGHLL